MAGWLWQVERNIFYGCVSRSVGFCTSCLTVVAGKRGGGDARAPLGSEWQRCSRQLCWVVRAPNRGHNRVWFPPVQEEEKEVAVMWMEEGPGVDVELLFWNEYRVKPGRQEIRWRKRGEGKRQILVAHNWHVNTTVTALVILTLYCFQLHFRSENVIYLCNHRGKCGFIYIMKALRVHSLLFGLCSFNIHNATSKNHLIPIFLVPPPLYHPIWWLNPAGIF